MLQNDSCNSLLYRRLTDTQLAQLHGATLEILEDMGVCFPVPEALEIFRQGGTFIDGDRVRIPSWRVEWALRTAPKQLVLYDQALKPAIRLAGRCSYFGNGSDLLYIIDHHSGERRLPTMQDVVDMVHLVDGLEHMDFVMSGFLPRDVPVDRADLLQMKTMLQHTHKPLVYVVTDFALLEPVVKMAEIVAGGAEVLRQRPFAACYINITNPLRHNPESIRKLLWLSDRGLPFVYRPALVTRGVSTPVTEAGFLVVQNAAALSGLVLSQLVREGAPFIRDACAGGTFDMQYMVGQQSPPQVRGFNEEMLHHYGLPGFGIGGNSGAKTLDGQSALEAALSLITSVQAGAHLIHDVGYLDNGTTGSLAQMVICDEIIAWIKAYLKPLVINEETLALDEIRQVVNNGGDFLGSRNTARNYRKDHYARLLDRNNYDGWFAEGATTLERRARARVDEILAQPSKKRFTPHQARAIAEIIERV
jgi:trimethylamine--corrinoid protein Co-methyltransferase